ncbi:hypothetical protein CALCODRAFT_532947 [Calocera cornea HHB12733]|uniref:Uncharacterized protein n=1 Tax=Calocera cornea HHB12733 TaxID=1353952 RepID=A0A165CXI7_9BASI|nr:hypothetical protein CALCODRAFT_532947 [Calocera cornea HHB12733]
MAQSLSDYLISKVSTGDYSMDSSITAPSPYVDTWVHRLRSLLGRVLRADSFIHLRRSTPSTDQGSDSSGHESRLSTYTTLPSSTGTGESTRGPSPLRLDPGILTWIHVEEGFLFWGNICGEVCCMDLARAGDALDEASYYRWKPRTVDGAVAVTSGQAISTTHGDVHLVVSYTPLGEAPEDVLPADQAFSYAIKFHQGGFQASKKQLGSTDVLAFDGSWSVHGKYHGHRNVHAVDWARDRYVDLSSDSTTAFRAAKFCGGTHLLLVSHDQVDIYAISQMEIAAVESTYRGSRPTPSITPLATFELPDGATFADIKETGRSTEPRHETLLSAYVVVCGGTGISVYHVCEESENADVTTITFEVVQHEPRSRGTYMSSLTHDLSTDNTVVFLEHEDCLEQHDLSGGLEPLSTRFMSVALRLPAATDERPGLIYEDSRVMLYEDSRLQLCDYISIDPRTCTIVMARLSSRLILTMHDPRRTVPTIHHPTGDVPRLTHGLPSERQEAFVSSSAQQAGLAVYKSLITRTASQARASYFLPDGALLKNLPPLVDTPVDLSQSLMDAAIGGYRSILELGFGVWGEPEVQGRSTQAHVLAIVVKKVIQPPAYCILVDASESESDWKSAYELLVRTDAWPTWPASSDDSGMRSIPFVPDRLQAKAALSHAIRKLDLPRSSAGWRDAASCLGG